MPSAVRPMNFGRVSMLMQTDLVMNNVRTNSVDLLKAQDQLSSGLRIARPSDSPAEATTVMNLDQQLERFDQFLSNMSFINDHMSSADNALGQAVELVSEANSLALTDTDDAGLEANAQIIDSIIQQLTTVANTQSRGNYVFAGRNGTQAPFEEFGGGVLFTGSLDAMQTRVSEENTIDFSFNGHDLFGALSSQVVGIADLDPDIGTATLLEDLNGALGQGIRDGSIRINDGTNVVVIDLSDAVTVGDVIDKINTEGAALNLTAAVNADGTSLAVTSATPGADLTITEIGTGTTARDLGIFDSAGGDAVVLGQDVDARLSLTTSVAALAGGAGIDTLSGLIITNSGVNKTATLDFSTAATLGDILNQINQSGMAVRATINDAGTGINVLNQLSGSTMSIGENGGTTAADLGIRSLVGTTPLADMNGGDGVHVVGQDNKPGIIRITDKNSATYDIDLSTAVTVQDVVALINAGTGGAVTAALVGTGNGIELTDTTAGPGSLTMETAGDNGLGNGYDVAAELGFGSGNNTTAGAILTGTDVNQAQPNGVFSHLIELRDAMFAGDRGAIGRAAGKLKDDETNLINFHGKLGARVQALEERSQRLEDNKLALEKLRSDIRDIDFSEAVTRYQNLYTALQANLMSAGQLSRTSLLDYLG